MMARICLHGLQSFNHVLAHGTTPRDVGDWSWEPTIIVGLALFVGAYLIGVFPLGPRLGRDQTLHPVQPALFLLGCLIFCLALVSPLEVLSDEYLFSAHMVQHIVLIAIVPPLWLLGTPGWLLRPVVASHMLLRTGRVLTHPAMAFLLLNVTFWLWHWPPLYDLAVENQGIHALQHVTFLSAAVVSWWPVLSPLPELPPISPPFQVMYLFASCQPNVALGALFVFSRDVLYRSYVNVPRLFDISPVTDQQIGGLIMWIPGNAIYLIALSIVFLRWLSQEEPGRHESPA